MRWEGRAVREIAIEGVRGSSYLLDEEPATIHVPEGGGPVRLTVMSGSGHDAGTLDVRRLLRIMAEDPELRPLLTEALRAVSELF